MSETSPEEMYQVQMRILRVCPPVRQASAPSLPRRHICSECVFPVPQFGALEVSMVWGEGKRLNVSLEKNFR